MNPLLFAALAVAGGVGASLRLFIDDFVRSRVRAPYPVGTTIINVSGSFVLGLVTGLTAHAVLPEAWAVILGAGLMGGYTTFSTASFETVRLFLERRWCSAILNGVGMLSLAVAAALAGLWLGRPL